jgi:aspartyl-tRNA(Asn)/glutamyl-tRNA(Gln) amidotransferase subunit A
MKYNAWATIDELKDLLARKEVSREDILRYYKQRFEAFDKGLNTAIELFDDKSILASSSEQGPLAGIPGILKDNIAQKNRGLTCASKILQGFTSPYDSTVATRLKNAGALLMGRANMDEFAMGVSNEFSIYGSVHNPWNVARIPGGSSGGSVAAVAAGLVPWALGSETGGSVRLPAALCGVVGLKPTYGLISRYGLVAYASSFDQIGIATRTVKDNAHVLSVLAGSDSADSTTLPVAPHDYTCELEALPKGLRIGVLEDMVTAEGMNDDVRGALRSAIAEFEKLGAQVTYMTIPAIDYGAAIYFILSRAEASSNLARFDGVRYGYRDKDAVTLDELYSRSRHDGFGKEVLSRIFVGNYVLSAGHAADFYAHAKQAQRLMREQMTQAFKEVDVLFAPLHAAPAFKLGDYTDNPLQMDLMDYFTCFANITGIPGLALPCGFTKDTLPIGFQLLGPQLSEQLLYQVGHAYERATSWHTMHPDLFTI